MGASTNTDNVHRATSSTTASSRQNAACRETDSLLELQLSVDLASRPPVRQSCARRTACETQSACVTDCDTSRHCSLRSVERPRTRCMLLPRRSGHQDRSSVFDLRQRRLLLRPIRAGTISAGSPRDAHDRYICARLAGSWCAMERSSHESRCRYWRRSVSEYACTVTMRPVNDASGSSWNSSIRLTRPSISVWRLRPAEAAPSRGVICKHSEHVVPRSDESLASRYSTMVTVSIAWLARSVDSHDPPSISGRCTTSLQATRA